MKQPLKGELLVIGVGVLIFGALLVPSLHHAQQERRDGIRRDEVAAAKIELEQYFNAHETYPREFDASPHQYVVEVDDGQGATGWYVRAELENAADAIVAFDEEAGRNYWYRIVREGGATYYDVCGGISRCGATDVQLEAREQ